MKISNFKLPRQIETRDSENTSESTDYEKFKFLDGNRRIRNAHVKSLIKSMKDKLLDTVILVNENFELIDGQHRFLALKELGLKIRYQIKPGYGLPEAQLYNINNFIWNTKDYAYSYQDRGFKDYDTLIWFQKKYNLPFNICIAFLGNTKKRQISLKDLKEGKFTLNSVAKATQMADLILKIERYFDGARLSQFCMAIYYIFTFVDAFDPGLMIHRISNNSLKLTRQATIMAYIDRLEYIYNYRATSNVIYFLREISDAMESSDKNTKSIWKAHVLKKYS